LSKFDTLLASSSENVLHREKERNEKAVIQNGTVSYHEIFETPPKKL
jgi:hypothetical protein